MLNSLVNNTDINKPYDNDNSVSCINDIFECIDKVQQQTDNNTKELEKIKNNTSISCSEVSANSISSNALSSTGIEANNIQTNSISVSDKVTAKDIEASGTIKAESITTKSVSTENISDLKALTVGDAWIDNAHADNLDVSGNIGSDSIQTNSISAKNIDTDIISTSEVTSNCISSKCLVSDKVTIQNACVGTLSTENFSSDNIKVSKLTSTQNSISMPDILTSGGIVGNGKIDVTGPVWKEIRLPLFTGTVQFYTDEWKVTITGGREFVWEDPSLEHLKFISNDGETVTVAVDWDGEVYYTYNVLKEPIITLVDNTGHTEDNNYTFIMQSSGIPRGTVFIYQDKEYANQGIDILGKLKASNLEITCSQSVDCLSIEHLHIGSSLTSDTPIKVDICSRCFCIASPCTYISNCLYTNNIESDNICNKGNITTKDLCADNVNVKCEVNTTKVCSCDNVTEKLYVNKCSEFHGPAYFYDNIYQCGETWCTHAQNVYTCSDTITMREGADFAGSAQIKVLKYDGENNGVIYLGKDGTLRVGDETNCQPVLTRSEEKDLIEGHGLVWDAQNKCAKDSGETIVNCAYVNCVGTECYQKACDCALLIGTECKKDACAYADTVSFCNINICRGISVIGTSTYCDSKCWGKDGNWTYLTFTEAPSNHWHYVMKMDGYEACRRAGFAFPADDYNQYGVYYKVGYTGGNDGWKLIPDIACVQKTALSCGKASETLACAYAKQCSEASCVWSMNCATSLVNTEETNRKHDDALCLACSKAYTDTATLYACSFAAACVQKTTPDTSTFAKSYGGSTNCVQYAHKARNVELGDFTAAEIRAVYIGNPIDMNANIGCNPNLWFCPGCNVLAMGSRDGATICLVSMGSASMAGDGTKYNPKIVFDSMDNQRGCLQFSQYDSVHEGAGLCWMTNQGSTWFDTDNIYANTLSVRNNSLRLGSYNIYIE